MDASRLNTVTPYAALRHSIADADILLCAADSLLGRLITRFTDSRWSHCGLIFRVFGRVLLLHAAEKGVQLVPLSRYVNAGKSVLCIARHDQVTPEKAAIVAGFGADQLGSAYDRDELLRIAVRITAGRGRETPDDEWICSELVRDCLAAGGVEVQSDHRGFVSPSNVADDPRVQLVARIR